MKKILLKLFSLKELWEEIQRREALFLPKLKETEVDEDRIYFHIKKQFPNFIDLLKTKEYNLTRDIFSDLNFTSGRRFELRSLISKLEQAGSEIQNQKEQKERAEIFKKIDEGIREIQEKLTK